MRELELFAAALQIADPAGRAAYLDQACAGDAALRQRIELLLRNQRDAGSFLEAPAAPPHRGVNDTDALEPPVTSAPAAPDPVTIDDGPQPDDDGLSTL